MRTITLTLCLMSSMAFAQAADLEQLWLDPSARGSLLLGNGRLLEPLAVRTGASLTYTYGNFRSLQEQSPRSLMSDRLGVQVFGAVGVTDWLELSAVVPVYVYQEGDPMLHLASGGLGNPIVAAKIPILGSSQPLALSFGLGLGIPVGTQAALGNGGIEVLPRVTLGRAFSEFQVAAELGGVLRPSVDFSAITGQRADRVSTQVSLAAFIGSVNATGVRSELTVRAFVPLTGGNIGLEGQVGLRYPVGDVEMFASLGPGFGGEPTTPSFRAYFGAAFANVRMTRPPCFEGQPYELAECPELDVDQDGVKNALDACPTVRGPSENKGCADTDKDNDGVVDRLDACVAVAGPAENHGCPWADRDNDGLIDPRDNCPDAPGSKDNSGCPDTDKDSDGLIDREDGCVEAAGPKENKGCPWPDSDADGTPNFEDSCPTENGVATNHGCPESKKQLVALTRNTLVLDQKVEFEAGRAAVQKKSNDVLDAVAGVLNAHPELTWVRIDGHVDASAGREERNKKLSRERAEAVKAYLVKKGVDEKRLSTEGYGGDRPADQSGTSAARAANERIEIGVGLSAPSPESR